ncbi:MAG: response regulator [Magnetococcales bacterium]|nr:response regulator [Magnetococcales bacterium]NGZ25789.1 response regulator [Magnetococcales bacterium]
MTLRRRIIMILLAFISIPMTLLGWKIYDYLIIDMNKDIAREVHTLMEEVNYGFSTLKQHSKANLHLFANSGILENYLKINDPSTRYEVMQLPLLNQFASYARAYPDYEEIRLLLPDGFEEARYSLENLTNVTEEEGDTPAFRRIKESQDDFVFQLFHNPDTKRPAFLASQRLYVKENGSDTESVAGYLVLTIRPQFIADRADRVQFRKSGFLFFTDNHGEVLFKPGKINQEFSLSPTMADSNHHQEGDLKVVVLSSTSYLVDGIKLLPELILYAALEKEEVYDELLSIATLALGGTLAGFLMLMALLYFMLERMVIHPILLLSLAVEKLGQGRYDIHLPLIHITEISRLFQTFNAMVGDLSLLHQRIEEHNRELESRVTERTLELQQANESLNLASQEAERANRSKSIFLATMSHEIRSPMNGIMGMLELLSDSGLTPGQHHMANMASRSAEGLLAILNDILDFSKVEAGKLTLEEISFELPPLLELTTTLMASRAMEKGLEIFCEMTPLPPMVLKGDPTRLQQVITNLLSNAIKFTEKGEVALRVWSSRQQGETIRIHFAVQDSGIGISPESLQQLFKPFTQADTSISRRYGGTGLGLAICRRLVEIMGGELTVHSQEDQGSTFEFYCDFKIESQSESPSLTLGKRIGLGCQTLRSESLLKPILQQGGLEVFSWQPEQEQPLDCDLLLWETGEIQMPDAWQHSNLPKVLLAPMATLNEPEEGVWWVNRPLISFRLLEAVQGALTNSHTAFAPSPTGQEDLLQGTILLAEDNQINQQVATEMLRKLGLQADIADNGKRAFQLFDKKRYDLILMDMQMPEMDGLEATRRIRAWEKEHGVLQPTPIVAMTANAMAQDRQECLAAGMDQFISKPVRLKRLREVLTQWLPKACQDHPKSQPAVVPLPPAPAVPSPAALDLATYEELKEVMGADFEMLQNDFLRDTALRLDELAKLMDANDAPAIKSRAHQLKGIGSSFGAVGFAKLCGQLQDMGQHNQLATAPDQLIAIRQAFAELHALMKAEEVHDGR